MYVLENGGQTKRALRQVTWAFNEDDDQGLAREVEVSIYGAKPTEESGAGIDCCDIFGVCAHSRVM